MPTYVQTHEVAPSPLSVQTRGIVAVPDAFDGTEELKVSDGSGHRLLRIEAESGVIDLELIRMLTLWLSHRPTS